MPLSRTDYGPYTFLDFASANSVTTTPAFTPPNNSLLVVAVGAIDNGGSGVVPGDLTITDTLGTPLTYTQRVVGTRATRWPAGVRVWTAPVVTGASMQLVADCGANTIHDYIVWAFAYTGHDTVNPVGATASGSEETGIGSFSMNLSAAPASGSEVLAFGALTQNSGGDYGPTAGSGWTSFGTPVGLAGWVAFHAQRRTGSTAQAVAWSDMSGTQYGAVNNDNPYAFSASAIEIREAAVAVAARRLALLGVG